ncbi:MAG: hypothetical protein JNJ73_02280 [Hyphomonadaceae bacterium]|nr:hypothetical protein [Hyphomonadaceae bacterium]
MRFLAVLCLLALAACGEPAQPPAPAASPAPAQGAAPSPTASEVVLGSTKNLPDWLLVARTADAGYVHFNQRSIRRNGDGTADIWVEIRHGNPQLREAEDEKTRTAIHFRTERLQYRFNCVESRFVILKRQFMGGQDAVAAEDTMNPELWRGVPATGIARVVMPVACRGR